MYAVAAITALIAGVSAAPRNFNVLSRANSGTYVSYNGDGSTGQGWPSSDKWTSFDSMWSGNLDLITGSCTWMGAANTSPTEAGQLKDAINSVSKSSGVDARVILSIVMQESKGCVRIWGTNNGVFNPGLMQDHAGTHNCNDGVQKLGNVQDPCPQAEIQGMIADGTEGTSAGDGLKQLLGGASDSKSVYTMARKYNSGSVAADGDLSNANGATAAYSSDIANRLMGVVFDTSSFQAGAPGSGPATSSPPATSAPSGGAGQGSGSSSSGSYTVVSGDSCWSIANAHGLTVAQLEAKNPSLGSACALQPGQQLTL